MHKSNPENSHEDTPSKQSAGARPQAKSISLYAQDLRRLAVLRQALSARCGRPVSASALVRVALRVLEREWPRSGPQPDNDDVAK